MAMAPHTVNSSASVRGVSKSEDGVSDVVTDFSLVVRPLEWKDSAFFVFEDEGPTTSEAVGAGYHYLAEAVDVSLAEAKEESQKRFEEAVSASVVGVQVPVLAEIAKALEAIIVRAEGGTVVDGQGMEATRERGRYLEKDIRDYARSALELLRAKTSGARHEGN